MWERPHDVASWRGFWRLPDDREPYRMRPPAHTLLDPQELWDELAEWDAFWTAWHEWRCEVLEDRYHLGIHYDRDEAERRMRFFRALPITTSGRWSGKRLDPLDWQEHQWLRPLYAYLRGDGTRLFHDAFVFVPKKQGKSDWAAGIVLDQLFMEDEPGAEVYGAAKTHGQATNVYLRALGMVKASPPLRARCKPLEATKRIIVPNPYGADSFYQVLSADVGAQEGPSMQCISIDELHVVPAKLLDVLTDGSGAAREQPIRSYTTTAGDDFSMPWYEMLQFAKGVEDGALEVPDFLPIIYGARPEEGDDWEDERVWYRANPSLGILTTIDEMRSEFAKAKSMPHKQASFKRRRLNIPIADGASRYLPMEAWDKCDITGSLEELAAARVKLIEELKGEQAVGWLDLSSRVDITTFGLLVQRANLDIVALPWFFLPEENLDARSERDRAYYRQWAEYGFIELTPGNATDQRIVRDRICEIRDDGFKFREIAYDDWNAGKIEIELAEEDGFLMVPVSQGIKTMSSPTKELLGLTLTGRMKHGGNPVLRYMADNLNVTGDRNERVQPNKSKSTGRIDGIVGIIMALDRIIRSAEEPDAPEPYKDRDVMFL